jgi:hypothetical protein
MGTSLYSQSTLEKPLRLSLIARPQLSWLKSDYKNVETDGLKMGLAFGLNLDYYFQENYAFSTGIFINNTGGKLNYLDSVTFIHENTAEGFDKNTHVEYKLRYIEIPFALKLKTAEIGYFTYFGQIGLNTFYNIGAVGDISNPNKFIEKENISDEVNFFSLGYSIGGGLEYSLGTNMSLSASLIFTNGFLDLTTNIDEKAEGYEKREEDKTILNTISFQIGVLF